MASNLQAIRAKVRRLTRSPSEAQITTAEIDEYINTFIQYDLPEHLRLFTLRRNFTFYASPNIGRYAPNTINVNDPLYNFTNIYTTFHKPTYCDGNEMMFSQSQEEFKALYPDTKTVVRVAGGDGVVLAYNGTLTGIPIIPDSILVESMNANNDPISLYDQQIINLVTGIPEDTGILFETSTTVPVGTINYETGVYVINFTAAPGNGEDINFHYRTHQPARPNTIFYFNNEFHLRPIPDKVYKITIEAYIRPVELLVGESPELEQWWQYIAFGTARKIFEDRTDMEGVAMIMPLFKEQERLVLRRTIVQQSNECVVTIYTNPLGGGNTPGW